MEETNGTFGNVSTNCSYASSAVLDTIDSVVCSSIAIFGIAGNLFSTAVFHRTAKLRRLTSSVYLTALAVSDTIFLTTLLLSTLALSLLKKSAICKSIFYFMNVSGVFSSWLVVLFTVERFVVIYFPMNKIVKFSRRRARYLVSFLIPVPFLMYIYTAVVLIDVDPVTQMCHWRNEYVFTVAIMHSVEICLTYFIPALVVVVLNSRIGVKLIKSDAQRQFMRSGSMLSTGANVGIAYETGTRTVDDEEEKIGIKHMSLRFSRSKSQKSLTTTTTSSIRPRSGDRTSTLELSATRTLIVISTAFAVLNLPHNLVLLVKLIIQLTPKLESRCIENGFLMNVVTSVCYALYYANFAVNIIVYHLTSCNYRQGAHALLTKSSRFWLALGRRFLITMGILNARNLAPPSDFSHSGRRRCLRRSQASEEKPLKAKKRCALLQMFHRSDKHSEPTNRHGCCENDPGALSTIPEADVALTDPKSVPVSADEQSVVSG